MKCTLIITKADLDDDNVFIGADVSDWNGDIILTKHLGVVAFRGSISASRNIRCWKGTGIYTRGTIVAGRSIMAAEGVVAEGGIRAGWDIIADGGIETAGSIKAGGDIVHRGDIRAGWGIRAGWDIVGEGKVIAGGDARSGGGSMGKRLSRWMGAIWSDIKGGAGA